MTRTYDERALWLARNILPHEPALRAWLHRRSVPGLDVDDIVQESYARLSVLESVADIRDPRTYLFQIAHSIIVSHVRRSRIVPILAVGHLEAFEMPSSEPGPERQIADHQDLHRLAEAIARLPGKIRDVFILRRVHDLSQRQVAERLGLSESTVEKHMSKGFSLIAALLGHGGNAPARASKEKPRERRPSGTRDDSQGY